MGDFMKKVIISVLLILVCGLLLTSCSTIGMNLFKKKPVAQVSAIGKTNIPANYLENNHENSVRIEFELENMTEKDIQGIEGTLYISDLFDNDVFQTECNFTGNIIPANSSITVDDIVIEVEDWNIDGTYKKKQKLYEEKFEDLKFKYQIKAVVYTDGTKDN